MELLQGLVHLQEKEPVFIDSEYETWNMDPNALQKASEIYPDVKIVIFVHLYGVPGKIDECKKICEEHGAILIEDVAESLGAFKTVGKEMPVDVGEDPSTSRLRRSAQDDAGTGKEYYVPTGAIGDYGIISLNGNKIITGSSGGALIVPDEYSYEKAKKWSTQVREAATWYEHEELGYNYRITNVIGLS